MDLTEIQSVWSEMSLELEKQKKITNEIVANMTQQQYKSRINKIKYSEIIGGIICLAAALFIIFNFQKLDTWVLQVCGIITIIIILFLPIFSFKAIKQMDSVNIIDNTYKQVLMEFAKGKELFFKVQKLSIYLGFILLLTTSIVFSKIMSGDNILSIDKIKPALISFPIAFIFFIFFTKWVTKKNKISLEKTLEILEKIEKPS